ncbi:pyridoxal phosphate-dependent aminotransferase family protein [Prolixibacter sp. SD074]|uniref:aminotransferase class I/II-fold pyridoxal phosphate-dependent enzyme n=1 Tax=Prolixibacter sp. SD074 TaxID=2652391 RepID=UPI00127F143C|nr:pyridoxal phosphate-dependent aminotransferase family protein [Prolixibacter sp. SD074]GET28506.1 2-amino-3-ketobutyrate CoA ligase [Prolixibacter sp. SD074]
MNILNSGVGRTIRVNDKTLLSYFAGNNYLGLANNPLLVKNAIKALKKYGVNFAASRRTTGTSDIHLELEKSLAEYKGQQDAVVFASGYMGNKILLHVLRGRYDSIFADSMVHSSITDGIPCDIPQVKYYEHANPSHLEELLKASPKSRPLIITDGIFALTGEIAPVDQLYSLAQKYGATLIVDDAHATGVLGENGRGTPEHFHLDNAPDLYQSETMSKAIGSYGGFIAGNHGLIEAIRKKSTFYGASTALPPPIVAAGLSSLKLIEKHPELRTTLMNNTRMLRKGIEDLAFSTTTGSTPIIPLYFKKKQTAVHLSQFLEENGIVAPAVDYPVKTSQFIVRITVSSIHTETQIQHLLQTLKQWREKYDTHHH